MRPLSLRGTGWRLSQLLKEAEIGRHLPQAVAQEPGATIIEMATRQRRPHPRHADLNRLHVHQWRQLEEPGPAARPRHLAELSPELEMSAAVRPASDRRCPAERAALQDVPASADDQARRPIV